nr:hypothetical protein [uncultured Roseovarius sp.]
MGEVIGVSPFCICLIAADCRWVRDRAGDRAWPHTEDLRRNAAASIDDETGPGGQPGFDKDVGGVAAFACNALTALADQIAAFLKPADHRGLLDQQSDRATLTDCNTIPAELAGDKADGHAVTLSVNPDQGRARTGIAVQLKK